MELVAQLPLIGPALSVALPFLVVLAIVVFVHEYGHYIVGRWCGIDADVFSVGFGRELYGWTDARGTRWRIAAIPLGGYVKFAGDADASSAAPDEARLRRMSPAERSRSFPAATVERRALTVLAGPVANFLLSILVFAGLALGQGRPVDEPVVGAVSAEIAEDVALRPGDRVLSVEGEPGDDFVALQAALLAAEGEAVAAEVEREGERRRLTVTFRPPARVDGVVAGGPAEAAGVRPGDVVVAVDGAPVDGFSALQRATAASGGAPMRLTLLREGATVEATVTPRLTETTDPLTGAPATRPMLGIQKQPREIEAAQTTVGPLGALAFGLDRTWAVIALSGAGVADMVSGAQDAREVLGGPIRIAEVSGEAAASGVATFLGLIAVLSTSIGLINLLPIPVLDGGHLMFYAIEKARGRPLRARWQEIGNSIGLALVLMLMAYATFNDLTRL